MKKILLVLTSLTLLAGSFDFAAAQQRYDPRGQNSRQPPMTEHRADGNRDHTDWRRGARMHPDDWGRGQRVDYRRNHLRRPPRGYEWREIDGRFVLAVIATGIIAEIILNGR